MTKSASAGRSLVLTIGAFLLSAAPGWAARVHAPRASYQARPARALSAPKTLQANFRALDAEERGVRPEAPVARSLDSGAGIAAKAPEQSPARAGSQLGALYENGSSTPEQAPAVNGGMPLSSGSTAPGSLLEKGAPASLPAGIVIAHSLTSLPRPASPKKPVKWIDIWGKARLAAAVLAVPSLLAAHEGGSGDPHAGLMRFLVLILGIYFVASVASKGNRDG